MSIPYDDGLLQNHDSLDNHLSQDSNHDDMSYQDDSTHPDLGGIDQTYDHYDSTDSYHQDVSHVASSTYDVGDDGHSLSFHSCYDDNESNISINTGSGDDTVNVINNTGC
jgi:hypothetical protein